jgi:hypothetical protein
MFLLRVRSAKFSRPGPDPDPDNSEVSDPGPSGSGSGQDPTGSSYHILSSIVFKNKLYASLIL